jgi:hypothetical protein
VVDETVALPSARMLSGLGSDRWESDQPAVLGCGGLCDSPGHRLAPIIATAAVSARRHAVASASSLIGVPTHAWSMPPFVPLRR